MISFFRIFDPVRIIALLLLFLLIKIPMMVKGVPMLSAELSWLLIGEKMASGSVLYKDIWFQIEPFAGGMYYFADLLFGKSLTSYHVINIILIFGQAVFLNAILNNNNTYNEKSSVPSVLYILFSSIFFDFKALSPALLGMTFIIAAFNFILVQLKSKAKIELILLVGTLTGIATLFYLSYLFFFVAVIIIMLLHLFPPVKMYFTLLAGFLIPYLLILCYYFLIDGLDGLYLHLIAPFFSTVNIRYITLWETLALGLPMIILSTISIIYLQNTKYINYQFQTIKVTLIWSVFAGASLFFVKNIEPYHLLLILPQAVILSTHFFLVVKNWWIREVTFVLVAALLIGINYYTLYGKNKDKLVDYKPMVIESTGKYSNYKNKRVLVLGNNIEPYLDNKMATPYLSWSQSSRELLNLDDYHHLSQIYQRFVQDIPEVIIDEEKLLDKLFYRLPVLKKKYYLSDSTGIYILKSNSVASQEE